MVSPRISVLELREDFFRRKGSCGSSFEFAVTTFCLADPAFADFIGRRLIQAVKKSLRQSSARIFRELQGLGGKILELSSHISILLRCPRRKRSSGPSNVLPLSPGNRTRKSSALGVPATRLTSAAVAEFDGGPSDGDLLDD